MSEEILKKLDKITEKQSEMNVTLVRQQGILDEHMRRTDLAEKNIETLQKEMNPLKTHVAAWGGVGKGLAVLSVLLGIAFTIWKMTGH